LALRCVRLALRFDVRLPGGVESGSRSFWLGFWTTQNALYRTIDRAEPSSRATTNTSANHSVSSDDDRAMPIAHPIVTSVTGP
jgi:hypothetical protein